jgi:hypothetical protein
MAAAAGLIDASDVADVGPRGGDVLVSRPLPAARGGDGGASKQPAPADDDKLYVLHRPFNSV